MKAGLLAYLRGKEQEAQVAVESGLRLNRDDPDLRFLNWVLKRRSSARLAYPHYRKLRRADRTEKWVWEVRREEELRDRQA